MQDLLNQIPTVYKGKPCAVFMVKHPDKKYEARFQVFDPSKPSNKDICHTTYDVDLETALIQLNKVLQERKIVV